MGERLTIDVDHIAPLSWGADPLGIKQNALDRLSLARRQGGKFASPHHFIVDGSLVTGTIVEMIDQTETGDSLL